jgi:hypothetical protein
MRRGEHLCCGQEDEIVDLSAADLETELVDLSRETLSSLGSLGGRELARVSHRLLAAVDNPPTVSTASDGNCARTG